MFLDEKIRLKCNEIGGYWLRKRDQAGWFCRIPQDIIEKADEYQEDELGFVGVQRMQYPCASFGGVHSYLNKWKDGDYFRSVDFQRLVVPDRVTELEVCDIPYSEETPLFLGTFTDGVFYRTVVYATEFIIKHKKEKIYDNYTPAFDALIQMEDKPPKGLHYHINYEGDQRELFANLERRIRLTLAEQPNSNRTVLPYSERKDGRKIYGPYGFLVHDAVEGTVFNAEIYPGKNAAPRISFTRKPDEFNDLIYESVRITKTGRRTGTIPY